MEKDAKLALTKQELEAKSLEFIDKIAAEVAEFPKSVQKEILDQGKVLDDAGVMYVHVVDKKAIMKEMLSITTSKDMVDRSRQSQK